MYEKTGTVIDLAKLLSEKFMPASSLTLELGECSIAVRSNSYELTEKLRTYYKCFMGKRQPDIAVIVFETGPIDFDFKFSLEEPEPGKTKITEEYFDLIDGRIVRKIQTGMNFIFGRGINIAAGECMKNYNQVINFINNRYIEYMLKKDCVLLNASGVALKNSGLAIAGFAGKGKSTLALELMKRGFKFLSNDRVMLRKEPAGPRMYGLPKLPRVNPGTILSNPALETIIPEQEKQEFKKLSPDELWGFEHKYDVDISGIFGPDRFVLSSLMKAMVILNWKRNSVEPIRITAINPAERAELAFAYMKMPGLFFEITEDFPAPDFSMGAYINIMKDAPVFEITGRVDFEEASELCMDLLEEAKTLGLRGLQASK